MLTAVIVDKYHFNTLSRYGPTAGETILDLLRGFQHYRPPTDKNMAFVKYRGKILQCSETIHQTFTDAKKINDAVRIGVL
jgi:hypothetical protein